MKARTLSLLVTITPAVLTLQDCYEDQINTVMHTCEMFATLKLRKWSLLLHILMIINFVLTGKKNGTSDF